MNVQDARDQKSAAPEDAKVGMARRFIRYVNDPSVGKMKKLGLMVVFAVLVVSPIDFIPDFIPFAGQVDDLGYVLVDVLAFVSLFRRGNSEK